MNAARVKHLEQVQKLYGHNPETIAQNLPVVGESLRFACCELARDCTIERLDQLVSRLRAAEQTLTRLRLAMLAEEKTGWGTG